MGSRFPRKTTALLWPGSCMLLSVALLSELVSQSLHPSWGVEASAWNADSPPGARARIETVPPDMPEAWIQIASPSMTGVHQGMDVGDFDQDGDLDVVAAAIDAGLQLWTGDGGNSWTDVATWTDPDLPNSGAFHTPALADIDKDGSLDLITSRGSAGGLEDWRFINGGWQQANSGLPATGSYYDIDAGDFNQDGQIDFVVVGRDLGVRAYAGDGGASWTLATAGLPPALNYNSVALGDINQDGLLDIVAGSSGIGISTWRRGAGDTGWIFETEPATTGTWWDLALGDVNRDGWLDIIAAGEGNGVAIWAGDGAFGWSALAKPVSAGRFASVDVADFNRDGALDLAAGTADDKGLRVWTGDGGSGWSAHAAGLPATGSYTAVRFGDINHDASLDLVAARQGAGSVHAWTAGVGSPPGGWSNFSPANWVASRGPLTLSIEVMDGESGLDPGTAEYSLWDGGSWGAWQPAACTGSPGTTTTQVISAAGIFFSQDSGPYPHVANQIRFQVSDMAGNLGNSNAMAVLIDSEPATNPTSFPESSHLPDGAWRNLNAIRVENWTGDTDASSGVHSFSYNFDTTYRLPDTLPETDSGHRVALSGPLPDGEWYLYMRTRDLAGNWSATAASAGRYRVDATPPQNPAGFVSDPATGTWTSDNTIFMDWSPGSDARSGVAGYAIRWTATPSFQPVAAINSNETFTTSTPLADGNSWYLHLRTADNAGNWTVETLHWGPFLVDATPPQNPAGFVSDPVVGTWTSDNTIFMDWSPGSDASSGVAGYAIRWTATPDFQPVAAINRSETFTASMPLADGNSWYLHLRTADNVGNWAGETLHWGPFLVDVTPPQNPVGFVSDPVVGTWTNDNTIFVDWSPGSDGGSGVGGYAIGWTATPDFQPVAAIKGNETYTTSTPLADGNNWYLHLRTADNAGNWTDETLHWGPFLVDTERPASSVTAPPASYATDFAVHWSGNDALSGVASYDVQVRDLFLDGSWSDWRSGTTVLTDTFHGEQGHTYAFRSRAVDHAGNVEAWPATADAITAVTPYEFEVYGMEVTQAVQDLNNSVVLVAGKRTYIRLHVRSLVSGDQGPVEARLNGWRDGVLLGTLVPNNPGGAITVKESPDRAALQDSFYFELPIDWLHGTVTLEAEVNPDDTLPEGERGNNSWRFDATFQDSPEMTVLIVDACYQQGGALYHATGEHRAMLASWLQRAFPIATLYVRSATFNPCMDGRPSASQSNRILRRNMRDAREEDDANLRYYGMIDDGGGFEQGMGSPVGHVASGPAGSGDWGWDFDGSYGDWYGAHELAHTFGRRHAEFCGAAGGDPYPYRFGDISPTRLSGSPDAIYGFDIETHAVYPPDWKDVMTYCGDRWISDFTYEGIRDQMLADAAPVLPARSGPTAVQTFLEVYGQIITPTQQVTLDTFFVTTAGWNYIPGTGAYSIRLYGAGDLLLASYPFTPLAGHLEQGATDPGPFLQAGVEPADIDAYVPWVPGTKRIAILEGTQQLASRTVSAHTPTVVLNGPDGGAKVTGEQVTLSWQGNDADGDRLTYWLEYSTDGGHQWQVLGSETRSTQVTLATAFLPGTNQGKFRILASDGVNTSSDETSGTFAVANKPPGLAIRAPQAGATVSSGQVVALSAMALDLEDGSLHGSAISWYSSLNGFLGTGELLHVTSLVTGTHTITVIAMDSNGALASAGVTLFVNVAVRELYLPVVTRR